MRQRTNYKFQNKNQTGASAPHFQNSNNLIFTIMSFLTLYRITDLKNYVITTTDSSWGKTTKEFMSNKIAFLDYLESYELLNHTSFIDSMDVLKKISNLFPDKTQIGNPNNSSCSFRRLRAEWVLVNIKCESTQIAYM